jgi:phosphoglycerate dehydrogenase-like enzyme
MEHRPRIVIPGDDPPLLQDTTHLERLRRYGDVDLYTDAPKTLQEQAARTRGASIVLATGSAFTWPGEVLRTLPELKLLSAATIGTDSLDLETAAELGITVCNVPGKTAPIVAEHALALMLAVARRTAIHTAALREGRWQRTSGVMLQGKTLGIVGAGNTGEHLARLAAGIGMRVQAWTFHPSPERAERLGVPFVELDDLLRTSDVVSIHLRLTEASHHLIGRRELELMKSGALLVNIARGAIVDNDALTEALDSGHLGGAGLDVFETEPVPSDTRLLACKHVVLTPHVADATPEGTDRFAEGVVDNVIAYLEGRPQNVVTPK